LADNETESGSSAEASKIIPFPGTSKLSEKLKKLRTEISMLILERDDLLLQTCPNIEAAYLLKIGGLEYSVYSAQCDYLRQKRRFELIAARYNRGEKAVLSEIEAQLDAEFEEYRQKLNDRLDEMSAAALRSQNAALSGADAKKLKSFYRRIAKCLHPDLHPDITEHELRLFFAAKEAYANGDLSTLSAIAEAAEGIIPALPPEEDSLQELSRQKDHLREVLEQLKKDISQIKSRYPYTLMALLDDEVKLNEYRAELEKSLKEYKAAAADYTRKAKWLVL